MLVQSKVWAFGSSGVQSWRIHGVFTGAMESLEAIPRRSPTSYRDETNGCYVTRSSESILGGSPVVQVVGCHLLHHRSVWPAGLEH